MGASRVLNRLSSFFGCSHHDSCPAGYHGCGMEAPPLTQAARPLGFKPDKVVGAIIIVHGVCHLLVGLALFLTLNPPDPKLYAGQAASLARAQQSYVDATNHIFWLPSPFDDGRTLVVVGIVQIVLAVLLTVGGLGVRLGIRKSLILVLVTAVISAYIIGILGSA